MAYEPTTWECGDVVTAERLNHMEEGIATANECCESGGGVLIVSPTSFANDGDSATITFDKTWQEISDALDANTPCYVTVNCHNICKASSLNDLQKGMFPILCAVYEGIVYEVNALCDFIPNDGVYLAPLRASAANDFVQFYQTCLV